jgi:flagellar motility protein MotE (MotC chaperone)
LIPAFVFAAAGALLWLNVFHWRDRLTGALKTIPIVGAMLPSPEESSSMNKEELIAQIDALNAKLDRADEDLQNAAGQIEDDAAVIENLRQFEEQQTQFQKYREEFEKKIVMQDPAAYADYYERVYKGDADLLYPQAATTAAYDDALKKYVKSFKSMDENSAAAAIEQLMASDMDLVVLIMSNMDDAHAGEIFSAMDPKNVASVIKMMAPQKGE